MKANLLTSNMKLLGILSIVLITVGSVDTLRNLPSIALFGTSLIFFFTAAVIIFLIPCTLIAAELTTTWPERGGIYVWVRQAFGKNMGFLAVWFHWIENVIWFPTILSFSAATLSYLFAPDLATNKFFLISVILLIFWMTTAINLLDINSSAKFNNVCTISGLIFPMILIIGLGAAWIFSGNPLQLNIQHQTLLPNFNDPKIFIALTGVMMSFCGMEIATVHVQDVKNPSKTYPRALIFASIVIIFTLGLAALSFAVVLPNQHLNLIVGIMEIFETFFAAYHLEWITPIIALVIVIGTIGAISNWILAPSVSLATAAKDGHLPMHFAKENRHRSPHNALIFQGIMVTGLMLIFILMPTVSSSYWLLTVLTTQVYMLMYILMFAAAIYLRFKHPNQHRPFKIPGKNIGIIIIAGCGILGAFATFVVGFIPPDEIAITALLRYRVIQICGILLLFLLPFVLRQHKRFGKHVT